MSYLLFSTAKPHVCETEAIYEAVLKDLTDRGATDFSQKVQDGPMAIDFGGAVLVDNPQIVYQRISFLPQHYTYVRWSMGNAVQRGLREGYYKLHATHAVCLSPETFDDFTYWCRSKHAEFREQELSVLREITKKLANAKQNYANSQP